jgi:catalase
MESIQPTAAPATPARHSFRPAPVFLVGMILLAAGTCVAYLRGLLSPAAVTADRIVDEFEKVDGKHVGLRRNHAHGLAVSGHFDSNGTGAQVSSAAVFQQGRVPVDGRFSVSGGNPRAVGNTGTARGFGLRFLPPGGGEWRTAMLNLPVFPAPTAEAFFDLMQASGPDQQTSVLAQHPQAAKAAEILKTRVISSGFGDSTFHSLNAFVFTNNDGMKTPVRWEFVPEQPLVVAGKETTSDAMFEQLVADLGKHPLRWQLVVILGKPGDPTNDATTPWPADRERLDVGTLVIDKFHTDEEGAATDITFDPLVLPPGMAPSDDPLLSSRSAIYSKAFTRRAAEHKPGASK